MQENENKGRQFIKMDYKILDYLDGDYLACLLYLEIIYWSHQNQGKPSVYYNGKFGTVLSVKRLLDNLRLSRFTTVRQGRLALEHLYEKGLIDKKQNFNSSNWYAPTDKLKEILNEQEYDNLTKFNNEGYNAEYDKNNQNATYSTNNLSSNQENQVVQPQIHYDETVPKGYIRNPDGSIRRKIATDPIDNSDFTFVESFAEIMNKR